MICDATFSDDGWYRYSLTRRWGAESDPGMVFCMLNPSTADAREDDPTVRRCIGFARDNGYGRLTVVNLFAFRATQPYRLFGMEGLSAIGPENDAVLREVFGYAAFVGDPVVAAWGRHGVFLQRATQVLGLMRECDVQPMCLNRNGDGSPGHPLYLAKDSRLEPLHG